RLGRLAGERRVDLEEGEVFSEGPGVAVATRDLEVRPHGTRYWVRAGRAGTAIAVEEGRVLAAAGGREVDLPAGWGLRVATLGAPEEPQEVGVEGLAPWAARFRPRDEVLWAADFEGGAMGWEGTWRPGLGYMGSRASLRSVVLSGNQYWGQRAAAFVGAGGVVRMAGDLVLRFAYRLERDSHFIVQMQDHGHGDDAVYARLEPAVVGRWTVAEVPLSAMRYWLEDRPALEGSRLRSIEFYTAVPGEELELLVDDVRVVRRAR
ncbi:MAG: hypothetical protein HY722_13790, partial [Planctomycetes bacterium]|nr:hypothetical protein [Planctomycetota bacterium]